MTRRLFLQAITAGLAVCGITRKGEAKTIAPAVRIGQLGPIPEFWKPHPKQIEFLNDTRPRALWSGGRGNSMPARYKAPTDHTR